MSFVRSGFGGRAHGPKETQMTKPVTPEETRQVLGPLDDDIVCAIIDTGATFAEVTEAYAWLTMDDPLAKQLRHGIEGRVAALCDLLAPQFEGEDERRGAVH
jgi:hypothetical protein